MMDIVYPDSTLQCLSSVCLCLCVRVCMSHVSCFSLGAGFGNVKERGEREEKKPKIPKPRKCMFFRSFFGMKHKNIKNMSLFLL